MSEIVKPRMLTKVQIEILRGELGHDDAYNLLCDMALSAIDLTTALENARKDAWQPIETAPKDGTRLWLYWPSRYKDDCQVVGWFYSSSDEFYWTDFNDSDRPTEPTHWRPLPEPPSLTPPKEKAT